MWSWFGSASAQQRKDAPKKAILSLREQLNMLQKRHTHLENQMAEQDAQAKKHVTTNKNAAKAALRRKKVHERSLEQTDAQIIQIEQQIYSIESANINQETLLAMKNAGTAMKQIHSGMTIEQVDKTMDDLREQHAISEEIVNAITSAPLGEPLDEADLDAELDELEQQETDRKITETPSVPIVDKLKNLPAAANGAAREKLKPQTEEEDEEAELEKLRAEMAI